MNDSDRTAPAFTEVEAARMLLEKMGIRPADLLRASAVPPEAPAFADYIPRVSEAVSAGTRRVYSTYWNRVVRTWGRRPITSVTPLEISQLAEQVKANVVKRRNARGGRGAAEHTILTWVERNFGFAVAQAYAGHEDHGPGGRAMATYVRAGLPEVATALAALTGEAHPLATGASNVGLGELARIVSTELAADGNP